MYSLVRLVPPSRHHTRPVVAAFDVDGTLTTRDCVTPFLRRLAGLRLVRAIAGHPVAAVRALLRRDNDRLKDIATSALRGIDTERISLSRSNGVRRPDRLMTVNSRSCTRSNVVKRPPQSAHTRRRLMVVWSSLGRIPSLACWCCPQ